MWLFCIFCQVWEPAIFSNAEDWTLTQTGSFMDNQTLSQLSDLDCALHRTAAEFLAPARLQSVRQERHTLSAYVDAHSAHHRSRTPHRHQTHLVRAVSDAVQPVPSARRREEHTPEWRSTRSIDIRHGRRHQLLEHARHVLGSVHAAHEQHVLFVSELRKLRAPVL